MKIMHIVEGFGGGVYSFLVDLCNSLSKEDEVILVYNRRKQTPEKFEDDFKQNIKLINLQMKREISIISDIKSFTKMYKLIKEEKPDILHLHSSKAGVLGRCAGKLLGFSNENMFYNPHGFAFLQENISKTKRNVYYFVERVMGNLAGTIIGVSKGEYIEGKKISNNCIRIDNSIDNTILDKYIQNQEKASIKKIGTIGRIMYQKNPKLFNDIAEMFPNMEFIWVGDGELKHELKSKNIKIMGWMDRYDAIEEMNDIDIYLQTSRWEGLPIALLEAMYMKKASIVTNVIGNRDVINSGVNGFICNNKEDFKECIEKVLNDYSLYTEIGNNAKKYIVTNHLLRDMVNKYKSLYYKNNINNCSERNSVFNRIKNNI
ncbi:glycosyltransferase family 4 protein [Clostridium beijerinckii]|uniref:glycosyltransferase family 4 protein n=1 Tax=Clostridium beijerinckii TaxID=1520 RepID=UPI001360DFB9|nr:glycosyltransferase family 4 protein [Clostridium beijerinckii]MZK52736.1 glycosyltransferase [Clostridium beijerinckii]MZK60843.1 glycosyltransferase [Clostridium beijerinckii]MZK71049.1 glycosyltransferase [Clostridium beijerinckii]MZK76386.1 glycosyltransferase [Clostridium beijerinckii]MZK86108.1 glycosyltransferase [Clostridium beijerinckii]